MKKIRNFLLRVLVITGIALFLFSMILSKGYQTHVEYKGELKSDAPTTITIKNTLDNKSISPESLTVQIYNEYNKAQYFEFKDVPEISQGVHKLIVSPDSPGKYIMNISYIHEGVSHEHC